MTSGGKAMQKPIIGYITACIGFFYCLVIILYSMSTLILVSKCMNSENFDISMDKIPMVIFIVFETIFGIILVDILKLFSQSKKRTDADLKRKLVVEIQKYFIYLV